MSRKRFFAVFMAVCLALCGVACCGIACTQTEENSERTFTVTFDAMSDLGVENMQVKEGEKITAPPAPERNGYVFGGWYLDENCTVLCDFTVFSVSENTTIYAKWIASSVTLTTNVYEAGRVAGQEITKDGKKYIRATASNNPGYTFKGWYCDGVKIDTETSFVYDFEVTGMEKTYVATWMKCPIILLKTINEGGSVAGLSQTALGKSATITATPNSGYTFKGWYDNGTRLTTNQSYSFTVSSTAKTYTAKFIKTGTTEYTSEKYFTAVYKAEGGTGDGSVTVRGGTKLKEPLTPTKSGYVFGGWYTSLNYTEKYNFDTPITQDVTLYAKWISTYVTTDEEVCQGGKTTGKEIPLSSVCSTLNSRTVTIDKDKNITATVKSCDCNVFGAVLRSSGNTSNVFTHSPTFISDNTVEYFDKFEDYLAVFMSFYKFENKEAQITLINNSVERKAYNDFLTKAKNVFADSNNAQINNFNIAIDTGAIIGIDKPYSITARDYYLKLSTKEIEQEIKEEKEAGKSLDIIWSKYYEKVGNEYILTTDKGVDPNKTYYRKYINNEYLKKIALLFGYDNVTIFKTYARSIANVYKTNSEKADTGFNVDRLKYDGAIYTTNGSFILPYAFVNTKSSTVLACVRIDRTGDISIWISDVEAVFAASELEKNETNAIEVYGRCRLFESRYKAVATTEAGYIFRGWLDNGTYLSTNSEYVFPVKQDSYKITAVFDKCTSHTPDENCICTKCGDEVHSARLSSDGYCRHGNYIYFGTYPQSRVTDSGLINALSAGTQLPAGANAQGWTSYGYYSGGSKGSFMWYIDKTYNGEKYRGVYFTYYRPYFIFDTCYANPADNNSIENTVQDDNGYRVGSVYWFRFEPVKWKILTESGGVATVLSELIIDAQAYNEGTNSNDYKLSAIRKWLNENFYNTAFSEKQKALIQKTVVDNGAASANPKNNSTLWNGGKNDCACENTEDFIYLPSMKEVTNNSYGFSSDYSIYDTERTKTVTEYAKSQGVWTNNSDGKNIGWWWLRSPFYGNENSAFTASRYGFAFDNLPVYETDSGVVPALRIKLS